jgi:hypothetical protein
MNGFEWILPLLMLGVPALLLLAFLATPVILFAIYLKVKKRNG